MKKGKSAKLEDLVCIKCGGVVKLEVLNLRTMLPWNMPPGVVKKHKEEKEKSQK